MSLDWNPDKKKKSKSESKGLNYRTIGAFVAVALLFLAGGYVMASTISGGRTTIYETLPNTITSTVTVGNTTTVITQVHQPLQVVSITTVTFPNPTSYVSTTNSTTVTTTIGT